MGTPELERSIVVVAIRELSTVTSGIGTSGDPCATAIPAATTAASAPAPLIMTSFMAPPFSATRPALARVSDHQKLRPLHQRGNPDKPQQIREAETPLPMGLRAEPRM